jgi:hypothetical protein
MYYIDWPKTFLQILQEIGLLFPYIKNYKHIEFGDYFLILTNYWELYGWKYAQKLVSNLYKSSFCNSIIVCIQSKIYQPKLATELLVIELKLICLD